jgi:hypothetical protein
MSSNRVGRSDLNEQRAAYRRRKAEREEHEKTDAYKRAPVLSISAYRPQSKGGRRDGRKGIRADFSLKPLAKGTIYQTIHNTITVGKTKNKYVFTEAWTVMPKGRKSPIIQNGTDSFLISNSDVAKGAGVMKIRARAWFEPGPIDASFERGTGDNLWGMLHGIIGIRRAPKFARVLVRKVQAKWEKGGPLQWTGGTGGVSAR